MPAHFCTVTGARIVAPGVSKAVDPENGQDELSEASEAPAKTKSESKAEPADVSADKPAKSGK